MMTGRNFINRYTSRLGKVMKYFLLITGSFFWCLTMVKSGLPYYDSAGNLVGLGFWGANGHDGIWHLALSRSLSEGSLLMPIFAGFPITNYHIGFDFLMAVLNLFTGIPLSALYFQILPVILSLSVGLLAHKFVYDWTGNKIAAHWSLFFVYFGGSFGWLIGKGESAFWSQQAISSLINPPYSLSIVVLLGALILAGKSDTTSRKGRLALFFSSVLFGLLAGVKVYAGLLALFGLFVTAIVQIFYVRRREFVYIFAISFVISLLIYLTFNNKSASLIVFHPFWFLETMMGLRDRLDWQHFYSAMLNYRSGHNWPKFILSYLVAFTIFLIGNFGTRIVSLLGVLRILKDTKRYNWQSVFILAVITAGIIVPTLYLQSGTPWNTIQFFYYSLFFSSILAGIAAGRIKNIIFLVALVLFTIPTTYTTLKDVYIPKRPPAVLPIEELDALNFLAKMPQGVILHEPFNEAMSRDAENNPPRPLFLYAPTSYISAFSGKTSFLADEINLDIMNYSWKERRDAIVNWFDDEDWDFKNKYLRENNIKYIYWIKRGQSPLDLKKTGVKNIYENSKVMLYEVVGD